MTVVTFPAWPPHNPKPEYLYIEGDDVNLVRSYYAYALGGLRRIWDGLELESAVVELERAVDFYYDVFHEHAGGILHVSMDDGDLERRASVQRDVDRNLERPERERDYAGIALGQLILERDDVREALRDRWRRRREARER